MKPQHKLPIVLTFVAVGMFGFCFALVPMYTLLCKKTGLNGKTGGSSVAVSQEIDKTRTVTVQFLATNNANLNWAFYPKTVSLKMCVGLRC